MSRLQAPRGGCVVRAYRHGLGDCFLIAFGAGNGQERYVLIDCGVLLGTANANATMTRVAEDIRDATGGHLHVLVLTHQHWDHISGFGQAQPVFDQIRIDALWVSWAENPDDPTAKVLLEKYGFAVRAVRAAMALDGDAPALGAASGLAGFLGPLDPGERWSTEKIMKALLDENSAVTRFCDPGEILKISGVPSVRFFVLGPPRDLAAIRKANPSQGQAYLTGADTAGLTGLMAGLDAGGRGDASGAPFNAAFEIPEDGAAVAGVENPWPPELVDLVATYRSGPQRCIDRDWLAPVGELAIKLDRHLNNTSLALAIELEPGGRVMLFPADAQIGNWLSWQTVAWPEDEAVSAADLLARTVLYKVGHHASHNATPSTFGLEMMAGENLTAIIPLDRATARKQRWDMPDAQLLARLKERATGGVYVTDEAEAELAGPDIAVTELYADITLPGPA